MFFPPLILMVLRPFFLRYLIDNIVTKDKGRLLIPFLLLFVLITILERLTSYLLNFYHIKVGNKVIKNEQIELYKHIGTLKPEYFASHSTGDITTKVLSDVQEVSSPMVLVLPSLIFNAIALVTYICVLATFSWKLTLITVCSMPLYYISLNVFSKRLQIASYDERVTYSKVNESIREKIEGIWTIKGLVKLPFFNRLFSEDVDNWISKRNLLYISHTGAQNLTYFITAIFPVIVLGFGGLSVMAGTLTLGTLIGFFSYITWIYEPINRINESIIELQCADPIAQRFFEILDESGEANAGKAGFTGEGIVKFRNIRFSYNDEPVLRDISFQVGANDTIALVGASGSGKSTIANLLCNFYQPSQGSIEIDHINIAAIELQELRNHIQIVRQHDYLFNLTVRENIVLDETFSPQEIMESCKDAGVDEFIDLLPEKYDTLVGERGSNLSDGQRQRICLARALIRRPKILILDEATSALDSNTEEKIFERLKTRNQTLIVISHRLSTICKADKVIVLSEGKVVDTGKHDDLIKKCPFYTNIISGQIAI